MTQSLRQIPWMRVTVEGVVIVASILLALALDAWWDGVSHREDQREYLVALRGELVTVRDELLNDQASRERRFDSMLELLGVMSSRRPVPPDSASALLQALWGAVWLNPPSGVFDLETSSSLIASAEIRSGLLEYRQHLNRLMAQEARHMDGWEDELRPYLLARTDVLRHIPRNYGLSDDVLPRPIHDSGFESALADRTFQNLLLNRLRRLALVRVNGENVLERIDRVLRLVDRELD